MTMATLSYAEQIAAGFVSVWFISWAIRSGYEVDDPLTTRERLLRWSIVAVGFALAFLKGPEFKIVRIAAVLASMTLLAWPNLAHRIVKIGSKPR